MNARAFVVMQVGSADRPERKRADEIFEYVVRPALAEVYLEAYRADLDPSPGPITPKMLGELVKSRLVIADLTGRNPNVFYELGIAHAFARPLISIADSVRSLPFDTKDERVIEIGEYPETGLTYMQGEKARAGLRESLLIVLADGYEPPSPLREVAANRSLDELAPENPIAAELGQMRETLEEIRATVTAHVGVPLSVRTDLEAMRKVIEAHATILTTEDMQILSGQTSRGQAAWAKKLNPFALPARVDDPWETVQTSKDPWSEKPEEPPVEEPPF